MTNGRADGISLSFLAVEELHTRSRGYGTPTWSARHTAPVTRLTELAGYQPTEWETRQLGRWHACQAAIGTLSCLDCGCASHSEGIGNCSIQYDTEQGKPVFRCSVCCGHHRAHQDAQADAARQAKAAGRAAEPGGPTAVDRDALLDAVENVVYAFDPTRGHEISAGLGCAAADLAEALARQDGDSPAGESATAAAAVLDDARGRAGLPAEVTTALADLAALLPAGAVLT